MIDIQIYTMVYDTALTIWFLPMSPAPGSSSLSKPWSQPAFFHFLKHSMVFAATECMQRLYPLLRLVPALTITSLINTDISDQAGKSSLTFLCRLVS